MSRTTKWRCMRELKTRAQKVLWFMERAPETLAQIAKFADQYLEAHGKHLFSSASKKPQQPKAEETKTTQSDTTAL